MYNSLLEISKCREGKSGLARTAERAFLSRKARDRRKLANAPSSLSTLRMNWTNTGTRPDGVFVMHSELKPQCRAT